MVNPAKTGPSAETTQSDPSPEIATVNGATAAEAGMFASGEHPVELLASCNKKGNSMPLLARLL
ncbi:hypothetical protein IFO70_15720 [Phormidium tenue FACHB-886]|nr:hypothetical protein [Phormidium tenue FACHB-886]